MTEPAPQQTAAPSTEPAATVPQPTTPTAPAQPAPPKSDNPWDDPEKARAEIERLRRENASDRTQAKQNAAEQARTELAQQIGQALGLVKNDEPVDPAKLTEQLTSSQAETKQARLELAVWRAAGDTADAAALLDSRAFLSSVQNVDPADSSAITEAITQAVTSNPRLARSQPTPATPGRMAPNPAQGTSAQPPLGLKERIAAAQKDGDMRLVARLKAAQVLENSK